MGTKRQWLSSARQMREMTCLQLAPEETLSPLKSYSLQTATCFRSIGCDTRHARLWHSPCLAVTNPCHRVTGPDLAVRCATQGGETAIMWAANGGDTPGHVQVVKLLLKAKAVVNARDQVSVPTKALICMLWWKEQCKG